MAAATNIPRGTSTLYSNLSEKIAARICRNQAHLTQKAALFGRAPLRLHLKFTMRW
jgi:hypothetical protein